MITQTKPGARVSERGRGDNVIYIGGGGREEEREREIYIYIAIAREISLSPSFSLPLSRCLLLPPWSGAATGAQLEGAGKHKDTGGGGNTPPPTRLQPAERKDLNLLWLWSDCVTVSTLVTESSDGGSNPRRTLGGRSPLLSLSLAFSLSLSPTRSLGRGRDRNRGRDRDRDRDRNRDRHRDRHSERNKDRDKERPKWKQRQRQSKHEQRPQRTR